MKKGKPFIIYYIFWLGPKWKKWSAHETREEAEEVCAALNNSPSGKYYTYVVKEKK